jgi:adenylate cyclase class IV
MKSCSHAVASWLPPPRPCVDVQTPSLGHFLEIKSRTWSRGDAQRKAELVTELLSLLGAAGQPTVTEDYIELATA